MRAPLLALALCLCAGPGGAQNLVTAISSERVPILSNFTGERISVFGVVEPGASARPKAGYDVVVTVRGPRGAVTVRRKEKAGLLWLNLDDRKYIAIPSFITVLSNRPVEAIADAEARDDLHIGIQNLIPTQAAARAANDPRFREALQRIRERQNLFTERPDQVRFISPTVFQATVDLPGVAPLGAYDVEVALFADGALAAKSAHQFVVTKSASEQVIAEAARRRPLLYGIGTALLALFVGWLASVIFRRD